MISVKKWPHESNHKQRDKPIVNDGMLREWMNEWINESTELGMNERQNEW